MKNFFKSLLLIAAMTGFPLPAAAAIPSEGLVKCADSSDIYHVDSQDAMTLEIIANEVIFIAHGFSWNDVVLISCEEIASANVNHFLFPDDKLLKFAGSPEVYEPRLFCNTRSGGCTEFYYHLPDETSAATYIGSDWQRNIIEVPASLKSLFVLRGFVSGMNVPYSDDAWYIP